MARLRVGGQLLHEFTRVSGLRWRHGIDGGCLSAEWTVSRRPSSMTHPAFKRGALVEVFHGLQRVWVGRLSEPGDDTSQLYATGLLAQADGYMAFDGTAVTDDVDDALTYATANGLSLTYLGDAPANVVPAEEPQKLGALIAMHATANSVRATVRADGILRWEADPTTPTLAILPGVGVLGRADEDFATRVQCRYISSVAGTPPVPDGYAVAEKINADAEAVYDRSTLYVDITDRGLLTATEAGWIAQGILDKFGARLSFTSGVTVNSRQLVTVGGGRVALQTIRAGQMVRFLGARTPSSFAGGAFDVVIGSTDYTDGSGEITLNPLGLVPRTLADIIASVPTIHTALNPMPGAGAVQAA